MESAYSVSWCPRNRHPTKAERSPCTLTATAWVPVIPGWSARSQSLAKVIRRAEKPSACTVVVADPVVP